MKLKVRRRTWFAERRSPSGILVFVTRVWVIDRHLNFELRTRRIKIASWWKGNDWWSER